MRGGGVWQTSLEQPWFLTANANFFSQYASTDEFWRTYVRERDGDRERERVGWLVGCFGFNDPSRQYFSLYRAVSQREGKRGEKG